MSNTAQQRGKDLFFTERMLASESYATISRVIVRVLALGISFFILSSLSPYEYGAYQLLIVTYAFFSAFVGWGGGVIGNDIFRFFGEGDDARAKKLFHELALYRFISGVLIWAGVFFGASLLSFRFGEEFIGIMRLLSFLFLHDIFFDLCKLLVRARLFFRAIAVRSNVNKLAQLIALAVFYFTAHIGIREVVLSEIIGAFVGLATMVPLALKAYAPWRSIASAKERFMMFGIFRSYGKWNLFRPLINNTSDLVQPWIIKVLLSTEVLGLFVVAKSIIGMVKDFFPVKSFVTLIPLVGSDAVRQQRIFTYGTKYMFLLSLVLAGGALIVFPPVIRIFFEQYTPALPFFYILLFNVPIIAFGSLLGSYLVYLRKQKFLFVKSALNETFIFVFYLVCIPLIGIWALPLERIVTPLVILPLIYFYLRRYKISIQFEWKKLFSFGEEDKVFLRTIISLSSGFLRKVVRV